MDRKEIEKRIADAVETVKNMDARTLELAVQAGVIDPRLVMKFN